MLSQKLKEFFTDFHEISLIPFSNQQNGLAYRKRPWRDVLKGHTFGAKGIRISFLILL